MKRLNRIVLAITCFALLIVSWVIVLNAKSNNDKQLDLMRQAAAYMDDGIYILSVPILEEAAGYDSENTLEAEAELKKVYLHLMEQQGYRRKYISLLEKQMDRKNSTPEIFIEAANFYLDSSKLSDALATLKNGIAKTGSEALIELYENSRYAYQTGRTAYEDVTAILGTTIAVQMDGLWGLANSDGSLLIPCQYEKISTYSSGRTVVQKDGEIYAVDGANNRLALPHTVDDIYGRITLQKEEVLDFGNYSGSRIPLLTDKGWQRASGELQLGSATFEDIGTYSNGYTAAKLDGKWGLINTSMEWLIPAEYDGILMDELGRAYAQNAVFVKDGSEVQLLIDGERIGEIYEDAKPFGDEGYAAVRKGEKWGFINTAGEVVIGCQFDDALSFGQHLAAVRQGDYWGYISLDGAVVIEPTYLQAKSFSDGSAPVLTDRGWQFITLLEYKKGASL